MPANSAPETNAALVETESARRAVDGTSMWSEFIPWFMTAVSVLVLVCLAWFLLENVFWFRATATSPSAPTDEAYRITFTSSTSA